MSKNVATNSYRHEGRRSTLGASEVAPEVARRLWLIAGRYEP